LTNSH